MSSSVRLVGFRLSRICPRDGVHHAPGTVLQLPEHVVALLEAARPPYGERVVKPRAPRTRRKPREA